MCYSTTNGRCRCFVSQNLPVMFCCRYVPSLSGVLFSSTAVLPSPSNVKANATTRSSIQLVWDPPEYECQAYYEELSYVVFWKKMSVLPPIQNLSLAACGKPCACTNDVGISRHNCIGALLRRQLSSNSRLLLHSSTTGTVSILAQLHSSENARTSITPVSCNSTADQDCCSEGLFVRLGTTRFNDTGLWVDALMERTTGLTLTIPIEPLTNSEVYVISVRSSSFFLFKKFHVCLVL